MSKFLRIDATEMKYLRQKARVVDQVFGSPNDVLRSMLGLEPKKKSKQLTQTKAATKIRIDDDVLEQLKTRAKQLNMDVRPLNKLLERIWKLEVEGEYEKKSWSSQRRRPPTR